MGGMNHLINTRGAPAPSLGIDIGRVLMCPTTDDGRPDTSFLSASDSAALAGATSGRSLFDQEPAMPQPQPRRDIPVRFS